jgi:CheY-like chemotaxis protein
LIHIRLFHWNATEAKQKASVIESAGYEVDYELFAPQALKKMRNNPPAAVVIDLSRLPSQGGDIAINIRHAKATRNIPIVFVEGDQEKVNEIRTLVPDALYTEYSQIHVTLKEAINNPPKVAITPKSVFERYRHAPLAKKLGIRPNIKLVLIDPPEDFTKTLGELPRGVTLKNQLSDQSDLIILFARKQEDLRDRITKIINKLQPNGKLWIAWRKKTPHLATEVAQTTVRKAGLALGLVDYKICSIDATWTGLLFTRRRPNKPSTHVV